MQGQSQGQSAGKRKIAEYSSDGIENMMVIHLTGGGNIICITHNAFTLPLTSLKTNYKNSLYCSDNNSFDSREQGVPYSFLSVTLSLLPFCVLLCEVFFVTISNCLTPCRSLLCPYPLAEWREFFRFPLHVSHWPSAITTLTRNHLLKGD